MLLHVVRPALLIVSLIAFSEAYAALVPPMTVELPYIDEVMSQLIATQLRR
jgi:hypothetical protein